MDWMIMIVDVVSSVDLTQGDELGERDRNKSHDNKNSIILELDGLPIKYTIDTEMKLREQTHLT